MKHNFLIVILILCAHHLCSQSLYISKNQAEKDIDSLITSVENIHINPYFVKNKKDVIKIVDQIKMKLNDSVSIFQMYNYCSLITSFYEDGHTSVSFPTINIQTKKKLPFTIDFDNEMKVRVLFDQDNLHNNSELVSINHLNINKIIDSFMHHTSGEALHFKKEIIKLNFSNLYYSIYGYNSKISLLVRKNNHFDTVIVNCDLQKESFKSNVKTQMVYKDFTAFYKKNICVIDFRDFSNLESFKLFLDTVFSNIKKQKIQNLIIDLRNNPGGNSALGDELFKYISKNNFRQYDKTLMKVSPQLKDVYKNLYLPNNIIDSFIYSKIESSPNGIIVNTDTLFNDNEMIVVEKNKKNKFNGKVYLITSHFTFSSATDFAWCFKHYKMGTIIGEETGGMGYCYGDVIYTKLPYSKLEINVSSKLFYNVGANEQSTHGVFPDIKIKSEDALKFTLDLIKSNHSK